MKLEGQFLPGGFGYEKAPVVGFRGFFYLVAFKVIIEMDVRSGFEKHLHLHN